MTMPTDTDNNFLVSGTSANAVIATDYSTDEGSHFQVMKIAYGNTLDFNRVTEADGLPVRVLNTPQVDVTSILNPVSVFGSVGVYGINGATAIAVTASNLGIRSLTAGYNESGISHIGADFVRVVGVSGAFPVGVSASNFGIRALTAGNIVSGTTHTGADFVRVVGASGAFPVGITATGFDIRGLTYTKDSVTVSNVVSVTNDSGSNPFVSNKSEKGFQTRLLRATTGSDPVSDQTALNASIVGVEDTVRVVGLSGAYPVSVVPSGLTGITNATSRVPFRVDETGALYVALAAGTIGVTANITGTSFTLVGVSLANAGTSAGVVQVQGFNGSGAIPVGVTATDLDIRNLSSTIDSVFAQVRLLGGACADSVDLGGTAGLVMEHFNSALVPNSSSIYQLRTEEVNSANILTSVQATESTVDSLSTKITQNSNLGNGIAVSVVGVAQPDGITSGRVGPSSSPTAFGSFGLKSGIHFKSDLSNSNTNPIFVGSSVAMASNATNGYPLYNGDQIFIEVDNANRISYACASAGLTLYYVGT